jgi:hypothetical protein
LYLIYWGFHFKHFYLVIFYKFHFLANFPSMLLNFVSRTWINSSTSFIYLFESSFKSLITFLILGFWILQPFC